MERKKPYIIAISGGSGSGKSTVTHLLLDKLGRDKAVIVHQDCYYKDLSHIPLEERRQKNFDHPQSIDVDKLYEHLCLLLEGKGILKPRYDFINCVRENEEESVEAKEFILLEGIFSLCFEKISNLLDLKIFVDVPDDLRLLRRIERDTKVRGHSYESVIKQYVKTVRPMHLEHIEPCRSLADFVIPWTEKNEKIVKAIASFLTS